MAVAGGMNILTLNVGSSSLKFGVYRAEGPSVSPSLEGSVDQPSGHMHYRDARGERELLLDTKSHDDVLRQIISLTHERAFDAVAHRVVHGGPWLRVHCLIDADVLEKIQAAATFAPLHVPAALSWIHSVSDTYAGVAQIACLDTAFHHPLPDLSRVLPVPSPWRERGVERYGFHGLSCESILAQLGRPPERLVIAHLGSGASLTAVRQGRSIDNTMGMTPAGGIIMGTRPGDLDPGVLLFLLREGHCGIEELDDLLEHHAGLKGISGLSADVRELSAAETHPLAALALAQFSQSVARHVAGMSVALGGIEMLVFTGGIGEHHAETRDHIIRLLAPCFPRLATRVLPAQENLVMAGHAARILSS